MTVTIRVMNATGQFAAASLSAVPASAMPMTIATLPVTMGGRIRSSAALPMRWISRPKRISTTAVPMMPTWANRTPSGQ